MLKFNEHQPGQRSVEENARQSRMKRQRRKQEKREKRRQEAELYARKRHMINDAV